MTTINTLPKTTDLNERLRGHLAHPALRRSVESHAHVAESVRVEAADRSVRALKAMELDDLIHYNKVALYAEAVADYARWLAGGPISADLAATLDIQ